MIIKRILTICAAVCAALAASAAGTSLALAQQGYPAYSTAPQPYPQSDYYRRGSGRPDFDGLDDEDGPNAQSSTALPPPGPVLSPDDPRYGRPMGAPPVYSDRAMPTGPILSPDDPRYGRPMPPPAGYSGPILSPDDPRYGRTDPPPVIYADRPAGAPPQAYEPDDYSRGARPPGAVGSSNVTGSVQPPQGAAPQGPDNRTVMLLPPDEQPDAAPVNLPPNLRRLRAQGIMGYMGCDRATPKCLAMAEHRTWRAEVYGWAYDPPAPTSRELVAGSR